MLQDMDPAMNSSRGASDEQFRRSILGQLRTEHSLFLRMFCDDSGAVTVGKEFAKTRIAARRADAGPYHTLIIC